MLKRLALVVVMGACSMAAQAPERLPAPATPYKVEFSIYEAQDGKRSNVRHYVMMMNERPPVASVRMGLRVPVEVGHRRTGGGEETSGTQYMDVGLNLDCRLEERDSLVLLDTTFEMSNLVGEQKPGMNMQPAVQQIRSHVNALVSPGKPTVIISMDQVEGSKRIEVEATATKLK